MKEKFLTLEQNVCAARIFLNTFGFSIENIDNINESSRIKIYNKKMEEAGELRFDNGKVLMTTNYNAMTLQASYDLAIISGFVDMESNNALFGQWSSKIVFHTENNNSINLNGEFLISCSIDSQYGISCTCHPLINLEIPEKGTTTLRIARDGKTFGIEIHANDHIETIDVQPWDKILHDIKKGEYDKKQHEYPYRLYAGIFNCSKSSEKGNSLHVFLSEKEYDKKLSFCDGYVPKEGEEDSSEVLIQKGKLMQKLDPSMIERINHLTELLFIDDTSLLGNLISVCYDGFTNEEIKALLGVERKPMNYQDGADSLINSYYGINKTEQFIPLETHKQFIKQNNQ